VQRGRESSGGKLLIWSESNSGGLPTTRKRIRLDFRRMLIAQTGGEHPLTDTGRSSRWSMPLSTARRY